MSIHFKKSLLSGLLLGLSTQAWSLGLGGGIHLKSYLNEPLKAEIEIIGLNQVELEDVTIKLADSTEYEKKDLEIPFFLNKLKFEIIKNQNNQPLVVISSQEAIKEPFVELLIELSWPGGNVIRDYTLLFDPPPVASKEYVQYKQKNKIKQNASSHINASNISDKLALGSTYGPTSEKDTLWNIAKRIQTNNQVSINQLMLAILNKNPDAFIRRNINGLINGKKLVLPTLSESKAINAQEAHLIVSNHSIVWQKNQEAQSLSPQKTSQNSDTPQSAPVYHDTRPLRLLSQSSVNQSSNPAEIITDKNMKLPSENLQSNNNQSHSLDAINSRVNLLEEALDTVKSINDNLNSKQALLEKQNESLNKLLTLRDEEIKKLITALKTNNNSVTLSQPEAIEENGRTLTVDPVDVNLSKNDNLVNNQLTHYSENANTAPITRTNEVITIPAQEQASSYFWLLIPLILLGSAAGGLGIYIRKNSLSIYEVKAELKMLSDQLLNNVNSFKNKVFNKPHRFNSNQAQAAFSSEINDLKDTQPVETQTIKRPIEETANFDIDDAVAVFTDSYENQHDRLNQTMSESDKELQQILSDIDIYLTYDRFETAEEVINEVLSKKPNCFPAQLKKLELFIKMHRINDISTWLESLDHQFNQTHPEVWKQALALLSSLELDNPKPGHPLPVKENKNNPKSLDLNEEELIEFDLKKDDPVNNKNLSHEHQMNKESSQSEEEISSKIDQWEVTSEFNLEGEELKEGLYDLSIKDNNENKSQDRSEEMVTKLELAKAYFQMNDNEGAKKLLLEVIKFGNDKQIEQAEALLKHC